MGRRRGHNEGSIQEIKDDNDKVIEYRVRVTIPGQGQRSVGRFKTRKEALRRLDEVKAQILQGRVLQAKSPFVETYLKDWLDTLRQTEGVRPRTLETYERNVRRITPHLGKLKLDTLTPSHVQNCYNALLKGGLGARSVRQVHFTLHKALKDAMKMDKVIRNVTEQVTLPRAPRLEMKTLTWEQLDALFQSTQGERFHALWVLLGTTGLRIGEAMGLKWSDIDLSGRRLTVRRALQRQRNGNGLVFVEPKSASSRRTLELTRALCTALRSHQERQAFERKKAKVAWEETDLVFSTVYGGKMAPEHIKAFLDEALKKASLPHVRIHDLRHTAATIMLHHLGLPVKLVSEMLGHSNIGITLSTYGHVMPGMHRQAADRFDALFSSGPRAAEVST